MASDTAEWRSLEPLSLAVNLVPDLWRTLRGAWPLLLPIFFGGPLAGLANLPFLALFFAMAAGRTLAHFLTLRYRVHAGKLEIRSGLIARQFRVIDPARIQNIEIVQNVFQKLGGLVELRVETAGESGIEGLLSAISEGEARRLRALLAPRADVGAAPVAPEVLHQIDLLELVGFGVSAGRVGAAVLVLGFAFDAFTQVSPDAVQGAVQDVRGSAAVGLVLLAIALGYGMSVLGAILRHYGFRMVRTTRGFALEAGLFTRRRVEIPVAKVQVVRAEEPWMRRLMGYGTLHVETAAVGLPGEQAAAEGVVPMATLDELPVVAANMLPRLDVDPWTATLLPPAPRALVRALLGGGVRWAVMAGAAAWVVGPWALLGWGFGPALAWFDWRRQGWLVTPTTIVARRGFLTRRTWLVARDKVQSVHMRQGPILRANGLVRLEVWVAGSAVSLPDLREDDARALFVALAEEQANRNHRADGAGQVGEQPRGDGVSRAGDADRAEVHGEHVEGGVAGAVHGGDELPDVGVGAVGLHRLDGEREGAAAGEGAQQGDGERLGGEAERRGDRGDEPDERVEPAAGAEHADGGEDGDEVGDELRRR